MTSNQERGFPHKQMKPATPEQAVKIERFRALIRERKMREAFAVGGELMRASPEAKDTDEFMAFVRNQDEAMAFIEWMRTPEGMATIMNDRSGP